MTKLPPSSQPRRPDNPQTARPPRLAEACRSKLALTLAAALMGGSLLSTCQTRFKEAVISGSTDYLYTLLSPTSVLGLFGDSDTAEFPDQ